jgi:hypothetical protein
MTLGKENPLVDSLTGGFSCASRRDGIHALRYQVVSNATGTAPPGGYGGTFWAGTVQAALPGATHQINRHFRRSFLRHFGSRETLEPTLPSYPRETELG